MRRDFWNDDNGPFNANANRRADDRKLRGVSRNLIPNLGVRLANSSIGSGIFHGGRMYTELYHKCYQLVRWTYPAVSTFPKSQRRLLSERIERTALETLELIIELELKDNKIQRKKILLELNKMQALFRISKDLSFLDFGRYEYASNHIAEMKQMLENAGGGGVMGRSCTSLYDALCSFANLQRAFQKAQKRKSLRSDVQEFAYNLESELFKLKNELETMTYEPQPLQSFVIRDPKTRVVSASAFRDRVVHHALCNAIEPLFERTFICDSYANRKGKGTLAALERFDVFKRKVSRNGTPLNGAHDNNTVIGFCLKCDIRHYFETVDHDILLAIIRKKIADEKVMWLIEKILANHGTSTKEKGMPIGNLTSQFFANVYLNELDYFIKHELRQRYYIRYVDDFVLLHESRTVLENCKEKIDEFLVSRLRIELHPEKSQIVPLHKGVKLLGFRCFYHMRLPRKSNLKHMQQRMAEFAALMKEGRISADEVNERVDGWCAYVALGNTHKLRKRIATKVKMLGAQTTRS